MVNVLLLLPHHLPLSSQLPSAAHERAVIMLNRARACSAYISLMCVSNGLKVSSLHTIHGEQAGKLSGHSAPAVSAVIAVCSVVGNVRDATAPENKRASLYTRSHESIRVYRARAAHLKTELIRRRCRLPERVLDFGSPFFDQVSGFNGYSCLPHTLAVITALRDVDAVAIVVDAARIAANLVANRGNAICSQLRRVPCALPLHSLLPCQSVSQPSSLPAAPAACCRVLRRPRVSLPRSATPHIRPLAARRLSPALAALARTP